MRLVGVLVLLACLAGAARAQGQSPEPFTFPGRSKGQAVELKGELILPREAKGPVPAMLVLHGSGGLTSGREHAYAEILNTMGVAAIIPDHFGGRGVVSTVVDQQAVLSIEMTEDAFLLLQRFAADPRLDARRIGIVGFSKGGTVALDTALRRHADRFLPGGPRFALHLPFYPSCASQPRNFATTGAPILLQSGADDTYVGWEVCRDFVARLAEAGGDVRQIVHSGAKHGWDGDRAYKIARGENYSRCIFAEQADGSWTETSSGRRIADTGGRPIPEGFAAALQDCRTHGVEGGPNPAVRARAIAEMQAAVARAFGL